MKNKKIKANGIQLIVYDFDGVMTDNRVFVFDDGHEAVLCNRSDGLAIKMIKQRGIPQVILSTESNPVVKARAQKLKLPVVANVKDKKTTLVRYCKQQKYKLNKVIYIGNDLNDLEAMKVVGYPIAPQDADKRIKKVAKIVTKSKGGEGTIKEFFDDILSL